MNAEQKSRQVKLYSAAPSAAGNQKMPAALQNSVLNAAKSFDFISNDNESTVRIQMSLLQWQYQV